MKSTLLVFAAAGLLLSHATKFRTGHPKTAFCLSGNVRVNHELAKSKNLKSRLDMIDPDGMVFAYVNPCDAQTKPWWFDMVHKGKKQFVAKKPEGDCWAGSHWKETLKPAVLKEYRDPDVAPVPRTWCKKAGNFLEGAHQQWKGVQECFKLIKEYEQQNSHRFETVARFRADACHDGGGCDQSSYCSIDKLDRQKVYMHAHGPGNYFDNFAIVSRQYADVYFNALDIYYADCSAGGPGEALLNIQMRKHNVPTEDKCDCAVGRYCRHPGKSLFIERRFLPDLESFEDTPLFMELPMDFLKVASENATSSAVMTPAYMRLQLPPSP